MTSSVWLAETDLALASRRRLVTEAAVRAAVGPSPAGTEASCWVFPRELSVVVEGTGLAAVVLARAGGWARPNGHNTAQFPRLVVSIFADSTRGIDGEISVKDSESRAWYVRRVIREILHRPYGFTEVWGQSDEDSGMRVWGSQELVEPEPLSVPDWDGGVVLHTEFGLNVG